MRSRSALRQQLTRSRGSLALSQGTRVVVAVQAVRHICKFRSLTDESETGEMGCHVQCCSHSVNFPFLFVPLAPKMIVNGQNFVTPSFNVIHNAHNIFT